MMESGANDAILVSEGLTPSASVEVRKLMNDGKFIVNMTPESLKFDIANHASVPPHRIISKSEKDHLIKTFGPEETLPVICMEDPVSRYYGAHPGDIFEITRNRPNVGKHPYYRIVAFND
jgi:DNA-directed RNA polymerase subunit H (RpoH/RPB5)